MKHTRFVMSAIEVALYVAAAVALFVWLAVQASGGGLFADGGSAEYTVVVPAAPAVEANKTTVVSSAGIDIGVVTGLEAVPDGAEIEFKVTGPVVVREDATAHVVVVTILGQKAVLVDAGHADRELPSGSEVPFSDDGTITEADAALAPIADLTGALRSPDVQDLVGTQLETLERTAKDVEEIVADAQELAATLGGEQEALVRIGRRSDALLDALAAKGPDIELLADRAAALASEISVLLDGQFDLAERTLTVAADTMSLLSARQVEIHSVLNRLPYLADLAAGVTEETARLMNNERGHFVKFGLFELPTFAELLRRLEEMEQ